KSSMSALIVVHELSDLVEELVYRLADALEALNLRDRQIRISNVPTFGRDLVLDQVVLCSRTANAGPAVPRGVDNVQIIRNLRHEVVDIGVPIAIIGRGEEQPCVVIEEHEAHSVKGADLVRSLGQIALQQLEKRAQTLRAAGCERDDDRQL